ncbi:MAG: cytidylate kinase family protein [Clostridia bacterium]|nr:cytidylate kinase family protein [Clostridia bacterium]
MNIHIITMAGDIASGKGTVTSLLKQELGYEIYKNGEYVRKLAKEMNMSIVEFQEYLNAHEEIDRQVEKSAALYASENDNLIIDARLGFYAVPHSFKVYLRVDLKEAARRAYNDALRKDTEQYESIEEAMKDIKYRYEQENMRYLKTYGVKRDDMSNYDLVIDTTEKTPEEIAATILTEYKAWLKDKE